jgi:hypothetical protein
VDRPRVLFVLGAGHCGSTLLGMLLNAHPECVGVSEISKLRESIDANDPALDLPEWREVASRYEAATGQRFAEIDFAHPRWSELVRWGPAEIDAWVAPRAQVFEAIGAVTGRPWIVDGSKSWQQLYLMERSRRFDLRVVHLVRDARGIVHSYAKKYGELGHGLAKWFKPSLAAVAMSRWLGDRWLRIRYEDLAGDPAATLARVCGFLGVDYDPAMLEFRAHRWLGIGGNRMSRGGEGGIRLDERWRREMSWRDRLVVDVVGGPLNRYYGY